MAQMGMNISSVMDPDPHGSDTFAWIQIRIQNSENSMLAVDPDPE